MKTIYEKEEGVSEVVGSLLILAITVMLFSTVLIYVSDLPTPEAKIAADFEGKLDIDGSNFGNITITSKGGETLKAWSTTFVFLINDKPYQYRLDNAALSSQSSLTDGKFSIGESFYYNTSWDGETIVANDDVSVYLFDETTGSIIWYSPLQGILNDWDPKILNVYTNPTTASVGNTVTFTAKIFEPNPDQQDDMTNYPVYIDLSSLNLGVKVAMNYIGKSGGAGIFTYQDTIVSRPNGVYTIRASVDIGDDGNYEDNKTATITIGTPNIPITQTLCDLTVRDTDIILGDTSPTHMSDVTVSITISNYGGLSANFSLYVNDTYPDGTSVPINSSKANPLHGNLIAAGGQTIVSFTWDDVGGSGPTAGEHTLHVEIFNVIGNGYTAEDTVYPNFADKSVSVLPRLLLVDDDGTDSGTSQDVVSYMEYTLQSCDFDYDKQKIIGNSDISTSGYDIIIWLTGYSYNPITSTQMSTLKDFYNAGGKVWIISSELDTTLFNTWSNITITGKTPRNTVDEIIGVNGNPIDLDGVISDLSTLYSGANGENVSELTYTGANMLIESRVNGYDIGVYTYNGSDAGNSTGKLVYMSFEFSRLNKLYLQGFISYKILMWFGGISERSGKDVAIGDLNISNSAPLYNEEVNFTVIVRNNGGEDESTYVAMYVDGEMLGNQPKTVTIPGGGKYIEVNFTWIADTPGIHTLDAFVDPYNQIQESNEANNRLFGDILTDEIYVQFSTIIINNATDTNDFDVITQAFDDLDYSFTTLNLGGTPGSYATALSTLTLDYETEFFRQYNLIIWVGGDCGAAYPIGDNDADAMVNQLQNTESGIWFVGSRMPEGLDNAMSGSDDLLTHIDMSISTTVYDANPLTRFIYGINYDSGGDEITRGMSYYYNGTNQGDADVDLMSTNSGSALFAPTLTTSFNQDEYINESSSVLMEGLGAKNTVTSCKVAVFPMDVRYLKGIGGYRYSFQPFDADRQATTEIVYMMLKWYGMVDERPELKISSVDIEQLDVPVVGHSYVISADIFNVGFESTSALVRFYENYELIGSDSVYIGADSSTTAEVIWTPFFGGANRYLRVVVDEIESVSEITNETYDSRELMNYNNEAVIARTIYYFYDDMETGEANWEHEATIVNINGEGPLDYFSVGSDIDTNITSTFNEAESSGDWITNEYYTFDSSYWLEEEEYESSGSVRVPIDVVFALDTSGSMSGSNMNNMKIAVNMFLDELSSTDRAAIWVYDGGNWENAIPELYESYIYCNPGNIAYLQGRVNTLNAGGYTPFYDTLGAAIDYAVTNADLVADSRYEFVIGLTDGHSNSDDTYSPGGYANGGAGLDWGTQGSVATYDNPWGDYNEDDNADPMWGLCNAPVKIYNIGLGTEHDPQYPNNEARHYPPPRYNVPAAYNEEYDLWNVADSSENYSSGYGGYYYCTDPALLPDIFDDIWTSVAMSSGSGQKSGSAPTRSRATVFADGWESNDWSSPGYTGSWIHTGTASISSNNPRTGSYHLRMNGDGSGYKLQATAVHPFNLGSYTSGTLTFWWSATGLESSDYGCLDIYSGGSWTNRIVDITDGEDSVVVNYFQENIDLAAAGYLTADFQIRFTFYGRQSNDIVRVDDIDIDCTGGGANSPPDNPTFVSHGGSGNPSGPDLPDTTPSLAWHYNDPESDAQTQYQVIVYRDSDDSLIWDSGVVSTSSTTVTCGSTLSDAVTYYWTCRVNDGVGGWSGTAGGKDLWYFTIDVSAPPPQLVNATNKTAVTDTFSIEGSSSARLTFWHRYNMVSGCNGVFIQVGYYNAGSWLYKYATPMQPYTGNLLILNSTPQDDFGNDIVWCWNGISGKGTFGWEYVELDLLQYVPSAYRDQVRVKFNYTQYQWAGGSGNGYGWYVDNVEVKVSTQTVSANPDQWERYNFGTTGPNGAHGGDYAWRYLSPSSTLKAGVDSSLITKQIDLSSARNATLDAYLRFNIKTNAGNPPDGFRVEISSDNGMTWKAINLGVRSSWNYSGAEADIGDGTSYSGIDETNTPGTYGWVRSNTLTRVNCDLSGWAGTTILLRIRVVTTDNSTYAPHYADNTYPDSICIDDVTIFGESTARSMTLSDYFT